VRLTKFSLIQVSGRNTTISGSKQLLKDRRRHELKPGTIARSGRTGTEEVDFSQFADFSFVEQVLGRRQESRNGYRQVRAMCLVVLARRNGIYSQFSCQPSGYRSRLTAAEKPMKVGGTTAWKTAIARRYATWDVHVRPSVSKNKASLGRPIPENYRLAPSLLWKDQIFPARCRLLLAKRC